jgi:hypothetical protein
MIRALVASVIAGAIRDPETDVERVVVFKLRGL